ncbi:hypothetical protein ACLM44_01290 [Synechococcus sp. W2B2]|uniref:hypothetical protein n=1 Tax=unclassified Synechococcus TaxID=2626047 RepID=UPI00006B0CC4|nr:hypothetical protein [Synechococcus sp. WH 7805]EAR18433.1 hypothetical protein WH7805_01322 [Synechococcus sp. WH 7805]
MPLMPQPNDTSEVSEIQPNDQMIPCALCQSIGTVHYRVRSSMIKTWTLICPQCWSRIETQPGYQYGGTRKANRRQRKR